MSSSGLGFVIVEKLTSRVFDVLNPPQEWAELLPFLIPDE
jgi:hypothetical protein